MHIPDQPTSEIIHRKKILEQKIVGAGYVPSIFWYGKRGWGNAPSLLVAAQRNAGKLLAVQGYAVGLKISGSDKRQHEHSTTQQGIFVGAEVLSPSWASVTTR